MAQANAQKTVPPGGGGGIRLEAERGQLSGVDVQRARTGYSGNGYVSGLDADGDRVLFTANAPATGLYDIRIRYAAPNGEKGFELTVNGSRISGMLAGTAAGVFAEHAAGKTELRAGANKLTIEKGWGYFDVDRIDLVPALPYPMPRKPPVKLADPKASSRARALMRYLVDQYGKTTLSGQQEMGDAQYIRQVTEKLPAILAGDLMDYSPSRVAYGSKPKDYTERMIRASREGHILSLSWHWNAPKDLRDTTFTDAQGRTVDARWYKGFYTNATTFDVQKALADPGSEDYRLLLRDIDAIAAQLKKLAKADVPVLWRPLHEAEGGWFWWGAKGPEPFKKLWRIVYDRLTRHHGLHNLLWVYTAAAKPEWYPGDRYVDIIGVDAYPSDPGDPLSGTWEMMQKQYGGRKLVALTEFGGVPDVEKMRRYGVRWSYFASWTGDLGPKKMSREALRRIYRLPSVITRDELPKRRGGAK